MVSGSIVNKHDSNSFILPITIKTKNIDIEEWCSSSAEPFWSKFSTTEEERVVKLLLDEVDPFESTVVNSEFLVARLDKKRNY